MLDVKPQLAFIVDHRASAFTPPTKKPLCFFDQLRERSTV